MIGRVQGFKSLHMVENKFLEVAKEAAIRAGEIIKPELGKIHRYSEKGENDFVTEIDIRSEEAIKKTILRYFPDHEILTEETGLSGKSSFRWIIDPLDGTKNFIHGFPYVAVSIALQIKGQLKVGVILDVGQDELYWAEDGSGAFKNGHRISVSQEKDLAKSMIATGFPFRKKEFLDTYLKLFREVFLRSSAVRRVGAAALDLALVASGIFDGFFEFFLSPWDIAAGIVIIREAGGKVKSMFGEDELAGNIIASNPYIFEDLENIVNHVVNAKKLS